jgi:DnaJ-class molecular chaperone
MKRTKRIDCPVCDGTGRAWSGSHPNDPSPRDAGPCCECHGSGRVEVELTLVDEEDLFVEEDEKP